MINPAVSPLSPKAALAAPSARPADHDISFSDVLSALNPLQYLPVVGTIYRAVTGDRPPLSLRAVGGIIAGGLMGGPVGAAISAAGSLLQHITGIDLDDVAHDVMAAIGLGGTETVADVPSTPAPTSTPTLARSATAAEGPAIGDPGPDPQRRQLALAAYGQTLYTYGASRGHA